MIPFPAEIIVDATPQSGRFNMAMDEALLELGAQRSCCVVRIYEWVEPTVTLGYFQGSVAASRQAVPDESLRGLPVVRRLSGGGAILHDRELTYSCVVPASHSVRHDPSSLYSLVHEQLIRLLAECGVPAMLRSELAAPGDMEHPKLAAGISAPAEPFLCFLRSNPNDIVHASGAKIVGSAQRRRRGVILQHGSLLLAESTAAKGICGIRELSPGFDEFRFRDELPGRVAAAVSDEWSLRPYTQDELLRCDQLLTLRD
jgi:lipoate-protein ligase A